MNKECLIGDTFADIHVFDFVTDLASVLVDNKEAVSLEVIRTFDGFDLTLKVAERDVRSILGHKRNTLDAIEILVRAVGTKRNVRISISLASHS